MRAYVFSQTKQFPIIDGNALITGHPAGLTPGTYGGIARDLLTFVANFSPWTGALAAFALPGQETQGKTRGICNIAAILKMKDNPW